MLMKYGVIGVVALCASFVALPVLAQQWNLANEFSTDDNPNPPWDVGTIDPANNFGSYLSPYSFFFEDQVEGWGAWQSGAVTKNITGNDFVGWPGQHWHPTDGMFLMPISSETHQMGVAWTSPVSDTVSITGRFYGATVIAPHPATSGPVRIVAGGSDIWNDDIDGALAGGIYPEVGPTPEALFDLQVDVMVGDQIMFGFGDNQDWDSFRYGLDLDITTAVISPGPEKTWRNNAAGDWNDADNWLGGVPDDDSEVAVFGNAIQTPRTVFTDSHVTVQAIQFNNSNTYAITGTGSITLQTGTSAPRSNIDVLLGNHEFQTSVNLNNDTDVTVASGSTLSFINSLNLGGNTLTKDGDGTMVINSSFSLGSGTIIENGGTISGGGFIGGDLINNGGTVSPGNSNLVAQTQGVPEPAALVLLIIGSVLVLLRQP